jgi:hypothetical protein
VLGSAQTYTPTTAEVGHTLSVLAVFVGSGGWETAATAAVVAAAGSGGATTGGSGAAGGRPASATQALPAGLGLKQSTSAGRRLQVTGIPAGWKASAKWYRGSKRIKGAKATTYKAKKADVQKKLHAVVTLTAAGFQATTLTTKAVRVGKLVAQVKAAKASRHTVRVTVKVASYGRPTGTLKVTFGSKGAKTVRLKASAKGRATITAPKAFKRGRVKVTYKSALPAKYVAKTHRTAKEVTL